MTKNIRVSHFIKYRLPAIAWAMIIFIASSIPSVKLPKLNFISADKLVHCFIFFVFGMLLYRALEPKEKDAGISWRRFVVSFIITISYGILDEVHQGFVPGRHVDKFDMMADSLGGLFAVIFMYVYTKRKIKPGSL